MANLKGKVAVVLGASAEGGTGWAIAEALAAEGVKVVVGARTYEPLKRLADKIGGLAVRCDAGKEEDVKALAAAATAAYGKVDIAVNSAGLPVSGLIADVPQSELVKALEVNYLGNVYFVREMAKAIGEHGSIVLISSMASTHVCEPFFAYACAKAGLDCLVRYAAREYGPKDIRINSLLPGPIVSEMAREYFQNPAIGAVYLNEIPLRRLGRPEDFAEAVVWLAGPAFVTGMNLPLNGGNQVGRFPYLHEIPGGIESTKGKPLGDR